MVSEIYVFDTNHISSLLRLRHQSLLTKIKQYQDNTLILSEPVIYEVEKGLLHKNATNQLEQSQQQIIPLFVVVPIQLADWRVASVLWSIARSNGKQIADIDLLVAAVALRLNGTVVTNDKDFSHLPNIATENWLG